MRFFGFSFILAAWLVGSPAAAAADPAVMLEVAGSCPTQEQARAALGSHVRLVERTGPRDSAGDDEGNRGGRVVATVSVTERDGAMQIAIRDGQGALSVERRIASQDCEALAEACAVMVHAHLVRLGYEPRLAREPNAAGRGRSESQDGLDPGERPSARDPTPAGEIAASPAPPRAEAPERAGPRILEPTVGPGVGSLAASPPGAADDAPGNGTDAIAARVSPPAAPADRFAIGLVGGVDVARAGSTQVSGVARLDVSWHATPALVARAGATLASSTAMDGPSALTRRQVVGRADVGYRLMRSVLWLQPSAGIGLAISRVAATIDNQEHALTRAHLVVQAGLGAGFELAESAWLRADLELSLYPSADRYIADQVGEIARSPRGSAALLAGIEWRL